MRQNRQSVESSNRFVPPAAEAPSLATRVCMLNELLPLGASVHHMNLVHSECWERFTFGRVLTNDTVVLALPNTRSWDACTLPLVFVTCAACPGRGQPTDACAHSGRSQCRGSGGVGFNVHCYPQENSETGIYSRHGYNSACRSIVTTAVAAGEAAKCHRVRPPSSGACGWNISVLVRSARHPLGQVGIR